MVGDYDLYTEERRKSQDFCHSGAIWHARRKTIHEQVYQSPLSVHFFVENFVVDLMHGEEQGKRNWAVSTVQMSSSWIPPPPGVIKINVDAAVEKNTARNGGGGSKE
jgi:hypothetical protein